MPGFSGFERFDERRGHGHRAGHVLRARAPSRLLPATGDEWLQCHLTREHEGADSWRRAELVPRQRDRMHAQAAPRQRHFSGRLHRVAMHQSAGLARCSGERRHVLDHARFVVRQHHRDDRRALAQDALEGKRVDSAFGIDGDLDQAPAVRGKEPCRFVDAGVFDGAHGDEAGFQARRRPAQKKRVGLRAATREDDLLRRGLQAFSQGTPRLFEQRTGAAPCGVQAGGVTEPLVIEAGVQRGARRRGERRGGVPIEIDATCGEGHRLSTPRRR